MPTYSVIDTAVDTTRYLNALKKAGIKTIIRYINPLTLTQDKTVKPAEAKAIAAAGMRLAIVCEGWGGTQGKGVDGPSGRRDGAVCAKYMPHIGAPKGACIFYAVDLDTTPNYVKYNVLPYFAEIKKTMEGSGFRIGIYASGIACRAIKPLYAELSWLTCSRKFTGTPEYTASGDWDLLQHCDVNVAGFGNDTNDIGRSGDIGDFVPFGLTPVEPPVISPKPEIILPIEPVKPAKPVMPSASPFQYKLWLQMALNKLGAQLNVDGDIGLKTIAAIEKEFYNEPVT